MYKIATVLMLAALGILQLQPSPVHSQSSGFNFARYKPQDFDTYLQKRKALSKTGIDVFNDWDPVRLDAELFAAPQKWSEGFMAHIAKMRGLTDLPEVNYGMLVITRKKQLVMLHTQDSIAESILQEIADHRSKGNSGPIGERIRVYASYVYNQAGVHGILVNYAETGISASK
jgi:hypothetical protein